MGIARRHVTTQLLQRLRMTQTTNWLHKIFSQSSQQKTELPQHTTGKKVLLMQFVWLINLGKERRKNVSDMYKLLRLAILRLTSREALFVGSCIFNSHSFSLQYQPCDSFAIRKITRLCKLLCSGNCCNRCEATYFTMHIRDYPRPFWSWVFVWMLSIWKCRNCTKVKF